MQTKFAGPARPQPEALDLLAAFKQQQDERRIDAAAERENSVSHGSLAFPQHLNDRH
jgi:hypothetical protein